MQQRQGFPNASIKLFQDYDAWLENRFLELGGTFITLTTRDNIRGINEGLLQIFDTRNMHTLLTGDEIIQVSLSNSNTSIVLNRIYGIKNIAVSVDEKGDNILTFSLGHIHSNKRLKFSRKFFPNATDTINTMMDVLYSDKPKLKPVINGINVRVPDVAWMDSYDTYLDFTREFGLSMDNDTFSFVWEDIRGVNMMDYYTMKNQEPLQYQVGEPNTIGEFSQFMEIPIAYDFQWLTKGNSFDRNPHDDMTYYTYNMSDKKIDTIIKGQGHNTVMIPRFGGYENMLYRNGYEESNRINIMSQYDSYAKFTTIGDFNIVPSNKIQFLDPKGQFVSYFYVDEIVHEISAEKSFSHVYVFSNSKTINDENNIRVKNEIDAERTEETNNY